MEVWLAELSVGTSLYLWFMVLPKKFGVPLQQQAENWWFLMSFELL